MKKISVVSLGFLGLSLLGGMLPSAQADEPCNMTLCMWGKVSGSPSDGCSGEIRDFFKKQVSKKGSFLPNHTADARKGMLQDECPASMVASTFIDKIIDKYGRIKKG